MELINHTALSTERLKAMILPRTRGWKCDRMVVRVRWSRSAEFSGTCLYDRRLIMVNVGRNNGYPYLMDTHAARPRSNRTHWWRPVCRIELGDACQLVLFVFLHELYHWLIRQARRNPRQKEGRCDRFAARVLVNEYACRVLDREGRQVPREQWDFQDLDSFVAAARSKRASRAGQTSTWSWIGDPRPAQVGAQGYLFPIG